MNVNDINIGDILISKEGDRFKITDFYPLNNDDNDYCIILSFVNAPKDWIDERIWTGRLNDFIPKLCSD